jgi:hypothetical protein
MDEKLVAVIKTHLPPGSEVTKIYKDGADVKADVDMGGTAMTVTLKKNHAGELYIE